MKKILIVVLLIASSMPSVWSAEFFNNGTVVDDSSDSEEVVDDSSDSEEEVFHHARSSFEEDQENTSADLEQQSSLPSAQKQPWGEYLRSFLPDWSTSSTDDPINATITVEDVSDARPFFPVHSVEKNDQESNDKKKAQSSSDTRSFVKYFGGSVLCIGILALVYKGIQNRVKLNSYIKHHWGKA